MENELLPPVRVFQAGKGEELVKSLIAKMKEQARDTHSSREKRPLVKISMAGEGTSTEKKAKKKPSKKKTAKKKKSKKASKKKPVKKQAKKSSKKPAKKKRARKKSAKK
jgi:hypothetical protein